VPHIDPMIRGNCASRPMRTYQVSPFKTWEGWVFQFLGKTPSTALRTRDGIPIPPHNTSSHT